MTTKSSVLPPFSVETRVEISNQTLSYLLCSAFEGGVGYWCQIQGYNNMKRADSEYKSLGLGSDNRKFRHIWVPLTKSGSMTLGIDEEDDGNYSKKVILTRKSIQKGLNLMAKQYPGHFQSILEDNFDAETGDVLLQSAVLGAVLYG